MGKAGHKNEEEKRELLKLLKEKLSNGQTCSSWLEALPAVHSPIPTDELQRLLDTYASEFEDFSRRPPHGQENDLKYSAIATLAKRCCLAYIRISLQKYEQFPGSISQIYELIQHCIDEEYFSPDYADGFRYVVRGLEILKAINIDDENEAETDGDGGTGAVRTLQKYLAELNSFDDLNQRNQVGVLALKQYFIGSMCRAAHREQLEIIEQMIKMDPDNCEWHNCLYVTSRFCRETQTNKTSPPSEGEKGAIEAALKLPGAEFDPRILTSQITCLASILKNERNQSVGQAPLRFGNNIFYTTEEVIAFIRSEAERIISLDATSVPWSISIAKIFSSMLPPTYRDLNFAQDCIQRALHFNPSSSKGNHRMSVLYSQKGNMPQALEYAKRAHETDRRNTYALEDILAICLGDIDRNKTEITSTFHDALNSGYDKIPRAMSKILVLKSIFNVLCGEQRETVVEDLLQGATIDEKAASEKLENLGHFIFRYKWHHNLRGKNIQSVIQQHLSREHDGECADAGRKVKLFKLLSAARAGEEKWRNGRRSGSGREQQVHAGYRGHTRRQY